MSDITVFIERDTDTGRLKIMWYLRSLPRGHYFVRQRLLEERAAGVRAALQGLVDAGRLQKTGDYPAHVRNLAHAGHDLFRALFFGVSQSDRDAAQRVLEWVEHSVTAEADTITFSVPSRLHIPWGLIYDRPLASSLEDLREMHHFWCEKYNVATHYFDIAADGIDTIWSPRSFPLLFGAHQAVWQTATGLLDQQEHAHLEALVGWPQQPKFALTDLIATWSNRRDVAPHGFLGFYCHASGAALCIGDDFLSSSVFAQEFSRRDLRDQPPTVVFLAGCQTAIGDLDDGFLEATNGPGYCGFIGTEVKVPDVFTLRFLTHFLGRFYSTGESLGTTIRALRTAHWPLSLVFSMCCARDLRLSSVQELPPSAAIANLSYQRIASG